MGDNYVNTQASKYVPMSPVGLNPDIRMVFEKRLKTAKLVWCGYCLIGILALCVGIRRNGGSRKFVPGYAAAMEESNCGKSYVDVHSMSQETGLICCNDNMAKHDEWPWTSTSYENEICDTKPRKLPFSRAIISFPGAWIIPILPVLVNLLCLKYLGTDIQTSIWNKKVRTSLFRILFYVLIMCFRGFILFWLLDYAEDFFIKSHLFDQKTDSECWFSYLSRPGTKYNICDKRNFDFSDHVVFFFGHLLPLIVFETIVWLRNSYFNIESVISGGLNKIYYGIIISFLGLFYVYLTFLSLLTVYLTSAFFHTTSEIILGYIASLLVQIPLGILSSTKKWNNISNLLGLPDHPTRDD